MARKAKTFWEVKKEHKGADTFGSYVFHEHIALRADGKVIRREIVIRDDGTRHDWGWKLAPIQLQRHGDAALFSRLEEEGFEVVSETPDATMPTSSRRRRRW